MFESRRGGGLDPVSRLRIGRVWDPSLSGLVHALVRGTCEETTALDLALWTLTALELNNKYFEAGEHVLVADKDVRNAAAQFGEFPDRLVRSLAIEGLQWVQHGEQGTGRAYVARVLGGSQPDWAEDAHLRMEIADCDDAADVRAVLRRLSENDPRRVDILHRCADLEDHRGGDGAGRLRRAEAELLDQQMNGALGEARALASLAAEGWRRDPKGERPKVERLLGLVADRADELHPDDLPRL